MTVHPGSEVDLRDRLSSLQGLLALSMVMTESGDAPRIVQLAATSVPSLSVCDLVGVFLTDVGWQGTSGPCAEPDVRADVEAQFAVLSSAGGPVAITGTRWGSALPLRSLDGHFGFMVVAADDAPGAFELFLLRALAQETGVALSNARSHARERAAIAGLREANETLAETVMAFERRATIHERLNRVAVAGAGVEGVATALHELTGRGVAVEDRHGRVLASAGPVPATDSPAAHDDLVAQARRLGTPVRGRDRLVAVAHPRQDVLGVLVLFDPAGTADEHEERALEHGATVLSIELARLRLLAETELRLGRDVIDELLAGNDAEHVLSRASALGYAVDRPHRIMIVDSPGLTRDSDLLFRSVRRAARDAGLGPFLVPQDSMVVILGEGDGPAEDFRAAVLLHLGPGTRCRIGVGGLCRSAIDFPRSRHEAQLALKVQQSARLADRVVYFDRLGIYRLLADVRQTDGIELFVREWLGALLDYDRAKRTDLVITVACYLENGGNYEATAAALAVHRSTLKYRLQRIRKISGRDLSDPDTQFHLQLASRARQTLMALGGEA